MSNAFACLWARNHFTTALKIFASGNVKSVKGDDIIQPNEKDEQLQDRCCSITYTEKNIYYQGKSPEPN